MKKIITFASLFIASSVLADAGEDLYNSSCSVCHASGLAGAPTFGDKEAWAPRIEQGMDTLYASALNGKGAMPPKGGSTADETTLKAAVDYMVSNVQ